jgi:hypothetical protein
MQGAVRHGLERPDGRGAAGELEGALAGDPLLDGTVARIEGGAPSMAKV